MSDNSVEHSCIACCPSAAPEHLWCFYCYSQLRSFYVSCCDCCVLLAPVGWKCWHTAPQPAHDRDTLPRLFEVPCHCMHVHTPTPLCFLEPVFFFFFCYSVKMLTYCPPCLISKLSLYSFAAEVIIRDVERCRGLS